MTILLSSTGSKSYQKQQQYLGRLFYHHYCKQQQQQQQQQPKQPKQIIVQKSKIQDGTNCFLSTSISFRKSVVNNQHYSLSSKRWNSTATATLPDSSSTGTNTSTKNDSKVESATSFVDSKEEDTTNENDDNDEEEEETGKGVIFGTKLFKERMKTFETTVTQENTTNNSTSQQNNNNNNNYKVFDGPILPIIPISDKYTIPQPSDNYKTKNPKDLWNRIKDEYSLAGQKQRMIRAESFFQACTRQANNPIWFGPGRIPNTFRSRHAILTMHIWFLHRRLIVDEYDYNMAEAIQEDLFQILWDDTQCRIRKEGVAEIAVNKLTTQVQQYTFLHLANYDFIYKEYRTHPIERMKELRKLIYLHILVRPQPEEYYIKRLDHLDRICWYIDSNYINCMFEWPDDLYRRSAVAWTTLPDFTKMIDTDGTTILDESTSPLIESDVYPFPWQRNITLKGDYYYWNQYTNEVTWEKPVGDDQIF